MNNLKSTRGATSLREMVRRIDRRTIDVPMLSRLENGLCLPTVEAMPDIERAYGSPRTVLYSPADLDFSVHNVAPPLGELSAPPTERAFPRPDHHRLKSKRTFRLPPSLNAILTPETLHACGYTTAQDWFCACLRRLEAQNRILSRRSRPTPQKPLTD